MWFADRRAIFELTLCSTAVCMSVHFFTSCLIRPLTLRFHNDSWQTKPTHTHTNNGSLHDFNFFLSRSFHLYFVFSFSHSHFTLSNVILSPYSIVFLSLSLCSKCQFVSVSVCVCKCVCVSYSVFDDGTICSQWQSTINNVWKQKAKCHELTLASMLHFVLIIGYTADVHDAQKIHFFFFDLHRTLIIWCHAMGDIAFVFENRPAINCWLYAALSLFLSIVEIHRCSFSLSFFFISFHFTSFLFHSHKYGFWFSSHSTISSRR